MLLTNLIHYELSEKVFDGPKIISIKYAVEILNVKSTSDSDDSNNLTN